MVDGKGGGGGGGRRGGLLLKGRPRFCPQFGIDDEDWEETPELGRARLIEDETIEDVRARWARAQQLGDHETERMIKAGLGGLAVDLEQLESKASDLCACMQSIGSAKQEGVRRFLQLEQRVEHLHVDMQAKVATMVEQAVECHAARWHQQLGHALHRAALLEERLQQQQQDTYDQLAELETRLQAWGFDGHKGEGNTTMSLEARVGALEGELSQMRGNAQAMSDNDDFHGTCARDPALQLDEQGGESGAEQGSCEVPSRSTQCQRAAPAYLQELDHHCRHMRATRTGFAVDRTDEDSYYSETESNGDHRGLVGLAGKAQGTE